MAKTHIRHAVSSDFPTLLEIDAQSFPPGIAYDSQELSYFMRRSGAQTLVLENDGEIAAFLLMEIHHKYRSTTLVTLDVRAEHRRKGFATELMDRSEEILRRAGSQQYELQVDVRNEAALEFYKKHGFTTVRVLRHYYSNGNDAYVMVKNL